MDLMGRSISHTSLPNETPTVPPAGFPRRPQCFSHVFLILMAKIYLPVFSFPLVSYLQIPSSIRMTRFCNVEGYNYHAPSV